jgi:hypothetical protein
MSSCSHKVLQSWYWYLLIGKWKRNPTIKGREFVGYSCVGFTFFAHPLVLQTKSKLVGPAYRFEYNSCKKASNVSLQFLVITVVISVLKNVYLFYPVEGQTNLNKHSLLKEQEPRHRVFWNNWSLGAIFIRFHAGKKQRRHTLKQGAPENPKARRHTARLFLKILWCGQLCSARNRRKIFTDTSFALIV